LSRIKYHTKEYINLYIGSVLTQILNNKYTKEIRTYQKEMAKPCRDMQIAIYDL